MITETTVETIASAKASGFRYVRSNSVAVVTVSSRRSDTSTPLKALFQACIMRLQAVLTMWLRELPGDRLLLFAATPLSDQHNSVSRRRGIWGIGGLQWLPATASRSSSVEIAGEGGSRFAGLSEVGAAFVEAADYVRTHGDSFLLVSPRADLTEERVRSMAATVFLKGVSAIDWAGVVGLVEDGEDIAIRASGGFDDREASLDAFLSNALLQRIGAP